MTIEVSILIRIAAIKYSYYQVIFLFTEMVFINIALNTVAVCAHETFRLY